MGLDSSINHKINDRVQTGPHQQKTVLYLRVSTDHQSVDSQKRLLTKYCENNGWDDYTIYSEVMSGTNDDRPVLNKLLDETAQGKIKRVVIQDLSRLSRKGIASTIRIVQHLIDNNVELISKSESIDTGSELGLLFISIISAFSKIENNLRNDKIKAGLAAAKARRNGQNWQRGKQRDESKDISIRILKEQGLSNRSIATQLGISRGKVERCLQSFKEGVA